MEEWLDQEIQNIFKEHKEDIEKMGMERFLEILHKVMQLYSQEAKDILVRTIEEEL